MMNSIAQGFFDAAIQLQPLPWDDSKLSVDQVLDLTAELNFDFLLRNIQY